MRPERVSTGFALVVLFASGVFAQDQPATATVTVVPPAAQRAFDARMKTDGDVLAAMRAAMRAYNPMLERSGYFLTQDTRVDLNWLKQTPNVWGMPAINVPDGAGEFMAKDVQDLISSAIRWVDITSLEPFPTGRFQTAIIEGLTSLAENKRRVTVRILVGWYPGAKGDSQAEYLQKLVDSLSSIKGSRLKIYVGIQRTNPLSFNHSKIIAVDGQRAIVGGENLWDEDYLQYAPVHDINVGLRGSTVYYMHRFANRLWSNVCSYLRNSDDTWKPVFWKSGMLKPEFGCRARADVSHWIYPSGVPTLGAGRFGELLPGVTNGNPADIAILTAIGMTSKTLRIAQQDLGQTNPITKQISFWSEGMNKIAAALVRGADVYIVLSNYEALAGPNRSSYSNGVTLQETADAIKQHVTQQRDAPKGNDVNDLLCKHLNLTNLRFNDKDEKWPPRAPGSVFPFALHAKFFMVDDSFFYVGSENLYPADLIEFGVFLSDPNMVKRVQNEWWSKLWGYSKRVAISGDGVTNCYFRQSSS